MTGAFLRLSPLVGAFARLRRASYFSLLAQREVTKRKGTPQDRSRDEAARLRESAAGFADSTSLCWQQTGPRPAGHPDGLIHHRLADPDGMGSQEPEPRQRQKQKQGPERKQWQELEEQLQEQQQRKQKRNQDQQQQQLQPKLQQLQQPQLHQLQSWKRWQRFDYDMKYTVELLGNGPSPLAGEGRGARAKAEAHRPAQASKGGFACSSAALCLALLFVPTAHAADIKPRVLDNFSDPSPWKALTSDQISGSLRPIEAPDGKALCLDYNFNGVSGHAAMRRALPLTFPANYQFDFRLRGSGPANAFEFKLIDASGENVWWVSKPKTVFPVDWTDVRYKARHISPAWGPLKDKTLRQTQFVEFTVYANEGGKGEVCIDDLRFAEREPTPAKWPDPVLTASSGKTPPAALVTKAHRDNKAMPALRQSLPSSEIPSLGAQNYFPYPETSWESEKRGMDPETLTVDFQQLRELGGLILYWLPNKSSTRYDVALSHDGKNWRNALSVSNGNGGIDPLMLTESEARYLRLSMLDGPGKTFGLAGIELKDLAFGTNANNFLQALAKDFPRRYFQRGFRGEQTYWTLVGIDGGHDSGLIGEDGAVEVGRGAFSIEPFVLTRDAMTCSSSGLDLEGLLGPDGPRSSFVSAVNAEITQSLANSYLPMPSVHWKRRTNTVRQTACRQNSHPTVFYRLGLDYVERFHLDVDAFAQGTPESSRLFVRYTLTNGGDKPQTQTLALAIQPFQVNPPVQFLTTPGGVSPIHQLAYEGGAVNVNGKPRVWPLATPTRFFATPFDKDMAAQHLTYSDWPTAQSVDDETGLASGALLYTMELKAHESRTVSLMIPLTGTHGLPRLAPGAFEPWVDAQRDAVAAEWREKLDRVKISVPPVAQPIVDTLRTALAHILINRDGVQIRPGTRSYARSWIRDGAMTSEALLRLGHEKEASDFLEWFAPYQFANGKVPCCVDKRGSDPVPENDSHGELMFLAAEVFRYGKDKALAEKMWPHVDKAARYMDGLRASERTPANKGTERYGLLPPTISHEGYSAKPAYSYWDDFWGLIGYKSALAMAQALGKDDDARRLQASITQFRADIVATISASAKKHSIDFIPGAADLGDFDATSTTMALSPGDELQHLPRDLLVNTFERYWREFVQRRDGQREWKDYTPYEWRNVAAFIRLGWRDRAHEAIAFFFKDRRPEAWNQWAEVVGKDYRESRFIGDMPHGWVASDYIRSALDLFAYERESDQSLVIAAGIPANWMDGDGVAIDGLRTPHGPLAYSLRRNGDRVLLSVKADGFTLPAGGLRFVPPELGTITSTHVNGRTAEWSGKELKINQLPAEVVLDVGKTATR